MQAIDLSVELRAASERAGALRQSRMIPAVVYGRGRNTESLKVPYQIFRRVFEKATYSTLVNLQQKGKEDLPVLVHDVQYHPVTDEIAHVDFYAVRMDEAVKTHIALEFVGVSEAVRGGAILQTTLHQVEISALPKDLVHTIQVDISALQKIGDTIRVKNLIPPAGITILSAAESPIVSAIELKIIEETPVAAAAVPGAEGAAPAAEGAAPAEGAAKEGEKAAAGKDAAKGEKKDAAPAKKEAAKK